MGNFAPFIALFTVSLGNPLGDTFGNDFYGGCSSVGRVPDCDSGCRGFEPHQPPHYCSVRAARSQQLVSLTDPVPRFGHTSQTGFVPVFCFGSLARFPDGGDRRSLARSHTSTKAATSPKGSAALARFIGKGKSWKSSKPSRRNKRPSTARDRAPRARAVLPHLPPRPAPGRLYRPQELYQLATGDAARLAPRTDPLS